MADIVLNSGNRVTSNSAKINDLEMVHAILGEYEIDCDILLRRDENGPGGMIRIRGKNAWPRAIMYDELPSQDGPDGPDANSNEWLMKLFDAGDEGFLDLLRDLGPYLATPLVVQAVTMDSHEFVDAKEWIIRPGAMEVETKAIDRLSDDTDDAGFLGYEEFSETAEPAGSC